MSAWEERIARRRFIRSACGAVLGLPLLPSLLGRVAAADRTGGAAEPRFVAVFSSNGAQKANFWPAERPMTLLDAALEVRELPLAGLPSPMSPVFGPALDPLRQKLLIVRGLDVVPRDAHGHYPTAMLSGYSRFGHYYETIDQVLARSDTFYKAAPYFRSIHQVVPSPQPPEDPISVSVVGGVPALVQGQRDARSAFETYFETTTPTALATEAQRGRRRLLLDRLKEQYDRLAKSSRLGAEDRQRLAAHAEMIHGLQKRLRPPPDLSACLPESKPELLLHDEVNLPQMMDDHIEVLVAALKCGLTRISTLQLCDGTDSRSLPFLSSGPFSESHHLMTHAGGNVYDKPLARINAWYADQVAHLLTLLDEVEDPQSGETYLDRSLVYWGNEFGSNPAHASNAMPVLLAGGACGRLRTGRYVDYRKHGLRFDISSDDVAQRYDDPGELYDWRGRPYNELLITILQAMGLTPSDYERGGELGFGDYYNNYANMYDLGDRRSPLPFIG